MEDAYKRFNDLFSTHTHFEHVKLHHKTKILGKIVYLE